MVNWGLLIVSYSINYSGFFADFNRATGPYWWAYWIMLLSSLLVPIVLFHKKWQHKKGLLVLIAFMSTIGGSFEIIVILITSFHQDYNSTQLSDYWMLIIRPFILALLLIGLNLLITKKNNQQITRDDILD